jgi:hypothetical protein
MTGLKILVKIQGVDKLKAGSYTDRKPPPFYLYKLPILLA